MSRETRLFWKTLAKSLTYLGVFYVAGFTTGCLLGGVNAGIIGSAVSVSLGAYLSHYFDNR